MNLALSRPLPRRTFLRGAGATVALPLLEAMMPRTLRAAEARTPPRRHAFIYTPNGYNQSTFLPVRTGAAWEAKTVSSSRVVQARINSSLLAK